jgi:hypothetical protein
MVQNEAENSVSSAASQLERLALDIEIKKTRKKSAVRTVYIICFALSARNLLNNSPPYRQLENSSNMSPDDLCYRWGICIRVAAEHAEHSDYDSTRFYFPERFIPEETENRGYED